MPKHNFLKNLQWRDLFLKIWKYIIVAIGIPTVVLVMFFSKMYIDTTHKEFQDVFIETSEDGMKRLGEYFNSFFYESVDVLENKESIFFLNQNFRDNNYIDNIINSTSVTDILFKSVVKYDIVDSIGMYSKINDNCLKSYRDYVTKSSADAKLISDELKNITSCTIITGNYKKNGKLIDGITIAFPAHSYNYNKVTGTFLLDLDRRELEKELFSGDELAEVFILKENNEIIPLNEKANISDRIEELQPDYKKVREQTGKNYYYIKDDGYDTYYYAYNREYDFVTVFVQETTNLKKMMGIAVSMVIAIFVFTVVAILLLSYLISRVLYNYMGKVIFELQKNKDVDEKELLDYEYIGKRFMSFVDGETVIEKDFVSKYRQLKESQVLALQTQINPHFIFNTLNLLNVLSVVNAKGDCIMSKIVTLLSDILQYSLNTEEFTTTIEEELYYTNKYIEIERLKSDNNYELKTEIDEKLLKGRVVKFSFQPIMENSIIHGFAFKTQDCVISLKIFEEGKNIHIIIKDNGDGASAEKINELNESFKNNIGIKRGRHIGLVNVNHRLKIIYGEEATMHAYNDDDGFVVEIIQPFEI